MLSLLVMDEGQKNKKFWLDDDQDYFNKRRFGFSGVDGLKHKGRVGQPAQNIPPPAPIPPQVVKKEITVKLELPKLGVVKSLKKLFNKLTAVIYRNKYKFGIPVLAVVILYGGFSGYNYLKNDSSNDKPITAVEGAVKELNFDPALPPQANSIGDIKGAAILTSDGGENYLKFDDEFQKIQISVSQQKFTGKSIEDVATALQAPQKVTVGDSTAYIKTNTKAGKQYIIYSKDNVLISITANGVLDDFAWQVYLKSLKIK